MKRNCIVIVTGDKEPSVVRPLELLKAGPCEVVRVDIDTLLQKGTFSLRVGQRGSFWTILFDGQEIDSRTIRSIWYRRPPRPKASKDSGRSFRRFIEEETQKSLWALWTSSRDSIVWMNHPMTSKLLEYNKPYQLGVAAQVGLAVPQTIITSDPGAALSFIRNCGGEGIIKVFGSPWLKNKNGEPLAVYTNRVTEQQILEGGDEIRCCPVMLENYVPKSIELRITVVGSEIFACAIHSQDSEKTRDDWRHYDFDNVKHEPFNLPQDVQLRLMRLMKALKINFGAIDMILTPEGEYVFLEVNPNGQWGWIEKLTGMSISQAIADVLADPRKAIHKGPV